MKEYVIQDIEYHDNSFYLICLSHNSILCYQSQIEVELTSKNGLLIVDQLLITGNSRNRFLVCTVKEGRLVLSTAKMFDGDGPYRAITANYLRTNREILNTSTLTDKQKRLIAKGCIL